MNKWITNNNTIIHNRKQKPRLTVSFHIYPEENWILEGIETLRRRDGWDQTRTIKEALSEYVHRHLPGNPAVPLEHWTENLPLSKAAQEKLGPKSEYDSLHVVPCPECQGEPRAVKCSHCAGKGTVAEWT
jgi:hypothetical protein